MPKIQTLWDYTATGFRLGKDWSSRLLLASALLQYKTWHVFGATLRVEYRSRIRIRGHDYVLHWRPRDIFIIHEIIRHTPYMHPKLYIEAPRSILDLGAHIGVAALLFKAHFPRSQIHCYEPAEENFRLLIQNTKNLPGITVHQTAVGGECGTRTFYYYSDRPAASTFFPKQGQHNVVARRCSVKTLDQILSGVGYVDLIKFDIEGAEWEVFSSSHYVHEVKSLVGEIKTDRESVERFLGMFPNHNCWTYSGGDRHYYIYMIRK